MDYSKYVTVRAVVAEAMRLLQIRDISELEKEDFIVWTNEAINKIGTRYQLVQKECDLKVSNKSVELPCDLVTIRSIKTGDTYFLPTDADFAIYQNNSNKLPKGHIRGRISIRNRYVYVNDPTEKGGDPISSIQISYNAWPCDENGHTLVRENQMVAIKWYLAFMYAVSHTPDNPKWERLIPFYEKRWDWECGQSRGRSARPDEFEMRAINYMWNQMLHFEHQWLNGHAHL